MALDTLAYAKHLEQAGVERRQAEAHAEAAVRYVIADLVTKADLTSALATLNTELTNKIATSNDELTNKIATSNNELANKIATSNNELTNKIATSNNELTNGITNTRNDLTTSIINLRNEFTTMLHQAELRILGVTFAMLGLLFALIKLT